MSALFPELDQKKTSDDLFPEIGAGDDLFPEIAKPTHPPTKAQKSFTYKTPEEMNSDIVNILKAQEEGPVEVAYTRPWSLEPVGVDEPITAVVPPNADPRAEIAAGRIKPGQVFYQSGVGKLRAGGPTTIKRRLDKYDPAGPVYEGEPEYTLKDAISDLARDAKEGARSLSGRVTELARKFTPIPSRLPDTISEALKDVTAPFRAEPIVESKPAQRVAGNIAAAMTGGTASILNFVPVVMRGRENFVTKEAESAAQYWANAAEEMRPEDQTVLDKLMEGAASTVPLYIMGMGVGAGVAAVARVGGVAAKLAPLVGAGVTATLEAAQNAGGVFSDLVNRGFDRQDAVDRADKVFWGNVIFNTILNKVGGLFDDAAKGALMNAVAAAPAEAVQEWGQSVMEIMARTPKGKDINFADVKEAMVSNEALMSGALGGIIGVAFGGVRGGLGAEPATLPAPTPPPVPEISMATMPEPTPGPDLSDLPLETRRLVEDRFAPIPPPSSLFPEVDEIAESGYPISHEVIPPASIPESPPTGIARGEIQARPTEPGSYPANLAPETPGTGGVGLPLVQTVEQGQDVLPSGAVEPKPSAVKVPAKEVLAHAKALRKFDLEGMALSSVERFILDAGGVRSNKDIRQDFDQDVPLYLRGPHDIDEVETEMRRSGVLGPNDSLLTAISKLKGRPEIPPVSAYMEQARRELQNDYEIYGPPKRGRPSGDVEPAPFERGPGYEAGSASKQTQTPEFKKWFGDSKVVDESGKPLVVYHVTDAKFQTFNPKKAAMGGVFWFTSDRSKIDSGETGAGLRPGKKPNVIDAYLSIQKMAGRAEYEKYGIGELRGMGYDGIHLEDNYVVFDNKQIKSATGNSGVFNPNDPNILRDRQPGLFGGAEPMTAKKPKPGEPDQMTLFGQKAQPKFEVPGGAFKQQEAPAAPEPAQPDLVPVTTKPGPQAQRLAKTDEGKEQVPLQVPRPLIETVVVKDLAEQGFLPVHKMRIDGPRDTAAIFNFLKNETVESFYVMSLDADDKILGAQLVSVGVLDQTLVNPTDAMRGANLLGAKKVVLVHNHPSLRAQPSREDVALTRVLDNAAKDLKIEVKHHVVIDGDEEYGLISPESEFSAGEVHKMATPETKNGGDLRAMDGGDATGGAPRTQKKGGSVRPERPGQVPLVKPLKQGSAVGRSLNSPQDVATFVREIQKRPGGVLAIALDTRNQPASAWWMGEKYQEADAMAGQLGRIAMRNNVNRVILVGDRLPTSVYMGMLSKRLKSVWGADVLDFTSLEGPDFNSARSLGLMSAMEGLEPYGKAGQSGRLLIGNLSDVKESFDHWFRVDKGAGPVVDRLNDERLGKIMVKAFDSSLNAGAVKAYMARNPSVPVKEAIWDYLRKVGPIEAVPPEIIGNVAAMRADIDSLSALVAKHGIAPGNETLRAVIEGNMGKYLGRYYRLFEQKKHGGGAYVPKPEDVKAFKDWARKERPNTFGKMSEEELDGFIRNVIDRGVGTFSTGSRKINVPQSHFIKRKDVPLAVRRLYGEIQDPVWLYLKTMSDQAVVAFNAEFLSQISQMPGVFQNRAISENYKKLPEGKAWGPVAGKYVTKDMHDFLIETLDPSRNPVFKALQDYIVNPFKWTKTVASIPSHPRNAMGNVAFAVLGDVSPTNPLNAKHYASALDILLNRTGKRANEWRELLRNRVVGGQYWGSEVPKMLNEMILDPQTWASKVAGLAKMPLEKLGNLYNNEDLVFRIAAYRKYRSQGMSEKEAAVKVDRYFTNYDKLPRAVKTMRDWGVLGPFLSFKASVVRIVKNAGEDAVKATKAGNPLPAMKLAAVLAFPAMLAKLSKEIFDVDDDDVKKLESYMQPYRRHGSMIYYRDDKGVLHAFDLSYIWPTGEFERAGRALLKGDWEAFSSAMDFFSHPVLDAWAILFQNVDPFTKAPVSSDLDPMGRQLYDRLRKLLATIYVPASLPVPKLDAAKEGRLEPGLLTGYQIKTLIDAYNGVTDRYGRTRELPDELRSFFTGIRTWRIYPEVVVEQFLRRRMADVMNEKQEFRSWMKRNPSARQEAKEERKRLFEQRMEKISGDVDDAKRFLKERVKRLEGGPK